MSMIRWGEFLDMLKEDGVTLETAEHEILTEDGERFTTQFLVRWVDGQPLGYPVDISDFEDPVPKWEIRRIAIHLKLPPDRYIFPSDMR